MSQRDRELLKAFGDMYADGFGYSDCYVVDAGVTESWLTCSGGFDGHTHAMAPGTMAVREYALIEGTWRTAYTCKDCVSAFGMERAA